MFETTHLLMLSSYHIGHSRHEIHLPPVRFPTQCAAFGVSQQMAKVLEHHQVPEG